MKAPKNDRDMRDEAMKSLTLVPFTSEHFSELQGWFPNERSLAQWGGSSLDYPLEEPHLWEMLADEEIYPPHRLCRMAVDEAGQLVGHVQIVFDWIDGVGRLSRVAIAPNMRGRGYAKSLLRASLEALFAYHEMQRTELNVYTWNTVAIQTYEKIGFVKEGVRRSCTKVGEERWDTMIMGLLRNEWEHHSMIFPEARKKLA